MFARSAGKMKQLSQRPTPITQPRRLAHGRSECTEASLSLIFPTRLPSSFHRLIYPCVDFGTLHIDWVVADINFEPILVATICFVFESCLTTDDGRGQVGSDSLSKPLAAGALAVAFSLLLSCYASGPRTVSLGSFVRLTFFVVQFTGHRSRFPLHHSIVPWSPHHSFLSQS